MTTVAQVSSDPAARPSQESRHIFVSHWHGDKALGDKLVELIDSTLYGGHSVGRWIFYTSKVETGLQGGRSFDEMLNELDQVTCVLGLVTRRAMMSKAAHAEMAVARVRGKLLPAVPRAAYAKLLEWPLDQRQACSLDTPDGVKALVQDLSDRVKRPVTWTAQAETQRDEVVRLARKYWLPPRWTPYFAAAALILTILASVGAYAMGRIGGYAMGRVDGRRDSLPARYLLSSKAEKIGGSQVALRFWNTFPAKRLHDRLHETAIGLDKKAADDEVRALFVEALSQYPSQDLTSLQQVVRDFPDAADLDARWRDALGRLQSTTRFSIQDFDNTLFAILQIDGRLAVLTSGRSHDFLDRRYRLIHSDVVLEEER